MPTLAFTALFAASCGDNDVFGKTNSLPSLSAPDRPVLASDSITYQETTAQSQSPDTDSYISSLDAEFEASVSEPDGSTASMIAYAEAYRNFWQSKIDTLVADVPTLGDEYAAFTLSLDGEVARLIDSYSDGDGAPFGSAAAYEPTWYRAERLRDWFCEHYTE